LTTYTHHSELQAITAPPLISTIHKSPQKLLSLFGPSVSSPALPWQRLLTVDVLQLLAPKSSLHRLLYRSDLVAPNFLQDNSSARTTQKHSVSKNTSIVERRFFTAGTYLPSCCPETALVYPPISPCLHRNGCTRDNIYHRNNHNLSKLL
jgi:hypothetical protein